MTAVSVEVFVQTAVSVEVFVLMAVRVEVFVDWSFFTSGAFGVVGGQFCCGCFSPISQ